MDRVFLDANVLFSAAYVADSPLVRLWSFSGIKLLTCEYAAEEARVNLPEAESQGRLEKLLRRIRIVPDIPTGVLPLDVTLPDKDLPIVFSALAGDATHLLTGDRRHFGKYFGRKIGNVLVLPPSEYFKRRKR